MKTEVHTQVSAEELAQTFDESEHAPVDLSEYAFEDWLSLALFWAMALAVFVQFFSRYVLNDSFAWTEEIATNLNVALVFVGSAMCVRMSRHIQVDFLYRYLSPGLGRALATFIDFVRIAFFAYGAVLIWRFMSIVGDEMMTTVELPKNLSYGFVFIGFVLMCFRSVQVAIANWQRGYSVLERPEAFDAPLPAET
ncbi:TRAP transporter small permease [Microvirga sp. VF16]|uniref:TRAP transporter small permease n=1 Tax=Microvirga sp. VF16 TaxID=2807101 RepID=UPI00193CEF45|nr:TRAP transporter small permease [Microvirga sp. VF16]QRM30201.1 TRAP transporter small permease [Microvirga sp. VF16]